MSDKIVKIREICDAHDGVDTVNKLLSEGWTFISACQVGTPDAMDIVYVVGATEEIASKYPTSESNLRTILNELE